MKSIFTKSILASLLGGSLLIASAMASAGICDAEYQTLIGDINGAQSLSDRDALGLTNKALASQSKANVGKIADAVQKLDDAQGTLNALLNARKPKIDAGDYSTITNDVNATKTCLAAVQ